MAMPLYFDPRQQPVKVQRASPEQVQTAKDACFRERGEFIRHYARLGPKPGLQALKDIYGTEGIAAVIEFVRMGDTYGPATMDRELQEFLRVTR